MRKFLLLSIAVFSAFTAISQDFSNKGKDFWVGYGYHQQMTNGGGGGSQDMVLYFATDQVTNITISIPGNGYTQTLTSGPGNNVLTSATIPKTGAQDSRLLVEGTSGNGIHITSDKPMVAYAHVYNASVSGATILYPTNTLGKEYYSINFKNISNSNNSNCYFYVVATDTGTTNVEITPSAATTGGWVAGTTYTVTLTQGKIYNVMGALTGQSVPPPNSITYFGVDLTGSKVRSVSTNGVCKRVAVYSGSGRISTNCPNTTQSSSDNYMVQALPKTAWGKKYLTVPSAGHNNNATPLPYAFDFYRICVQDPTTVVKLNGVVLAAGTLINNFYYEFGQSNQPNLIEADKAITVAQYFSSAGTCGNPGGDGDPEVIYLSSVEQNINKVQWNAVAKNAIRQNKHYISLVIPNTGTGISSLKLDGVLVPASNFILHPQLAGYSYAVLNVLGNAQGTTGYPHTLQSDSGFNAIAYGYGGTESYGYNAGTNIKDLYQQIGVQTQYGIETTPSVCTNSPFKFKVSLPYIPDSMYWDFHNAANLLPNNTNVFVSNVPVNSEDSSTVVNGRTLHWYSLPTLYHFTALGTYPITITTYGINIDSCGTFQDIDFDLFVSDPPIASFTATGSGCVAEPVQFTETTPQFPKTTYHFWWDFGDPASGAANNTSALRNPTHLFSAPGTYNVRFSDITTPGCLSDTITNQVIVAPLPSATISGNTTVCINDPMPFITFTGTQGTPEYIFYYNIDNGGGPGPTLTVGPSVGGIATIPAPTIVAGTYVYTLLSVKNSGSVLCTQNISGQQVTVVVRPNATIALSSAPGTNNQTVCINNPITNITYAIGGSGTGASITAGVLPAGVTGSFAGGVFTITGTPTVSGVFNYTVTTLGPCINNSLSGTITVNANSTIALSSAAGTDNQTVCINNPIVDITYAIAAGGTGASITAGALPAGVTGSFAGGVFTITGTPTVSGVFNYTVTTLGPCINPALSGTITVTANSTLTLTSAPGTNNQSVCRNTAIVDITYSIAGSGTGASVTAGGLPAGVTGSYAGGIFTITGTPTVSGVFNYTVTTSGPCVNPSLSGTITVYALPTPNFTFVPPSCETRTIVFTDASVPNSGALSIWNWNFDDPASGAANTSGLQNPSHIFATARIYNVTLSVTSSLGCISNPVANIPVTINARPQAGYIIPEVCLSDTYAQFNDTSKVLGGTIVAWAWNFGDPISGPLNTSALQNPQHSYTAVGNYNVRLIVTSNNGCKDTITQVLSINGSFPVANFTVNNAATLCANDSVAIVNASTVFPGTITKVEIYWDNVGQPAVFQLDDFPFFGKTYRHLYPNFQAPLTKNFTIRFRAYSGGVCVNDKLLVITVNAAPRVQFNPLPNSCLNVAPFQITQATETGGVPGTYVFSGPGVSATGIFSPLSVGPGTYTIKYTYTSAAGGCVDSASRQITVLVAPVADFSFSTPDCETKAVTFTDASTNTVGSLTTWTWDFGDGTPVVVRNTNAPFTHIFAAAGNYTVKLFVTTSDGCNSTVKQLSVVVKPQPRPNFTFPASVCLPSVTVMFTNTSTISDGTQASFTYLWDFGDPGSGANNTSTLMNPTHVYSGVGPFNVNLQVTSGAGCVHDTTIVMNNIHPQPIANFSANKTSVCIGETINFTDLSNGLDGTVNQWRWDFGDASTSTVQNPTHAYVINNNYTVSLYIINSNGCNSDTMRQVMTVLDPPVADFSFGAPDCATKDVTFTDASNAPVGSLTTWTWDFNDGTPLVVNNTNAPFTHVFALTGTYNVVLIVTTNNGCNSAPKSLPVDIHPLPRPNFSFDKIFYCIPNATVTFNNTSTIADGTENAFTYLWNFGDIASGLNNSSVAKTPTHYYLTQGPYNVNLQVTSGNGCVYDTTIVLNSIHPQPKADFKTSKPSVCIADDVTFIDNSLGMDGTVTGWTWDFGDGTKAFVNPAPHLYVSIDTFKVSLYITNSIGCNSDTLIKPFTVYPYPVVDAGPDRFILEGGSIVLQPVVTGNDLQFLWTPNLNMADNRLEKPTVNKPLDDITYKLTVTGRGGCAQSDIMFVKLLRFPKIPNTFTPNNDGINDTWRIDYLNTYPNNRVQVFTRTGQLVFESHGYNSPWDGTIKGKPLPFDTYYYIIEPGNGRDPITGYVTIIK